MHFNKINLQYGLYYSYSRKYAFMAIIRNIDVKSSGCAKGCIQPIIRVVPLGNLQACAHMTLPKPVSGLAVGMCILV